MIRRGMALGAVLLALGACATPPAPEYATVCDDVAEPDCAPDTDVEIIE